MKSIHILSVVGILLCVVGLSFSQNCNQTLPREECCNTTGCGYFGCDQVTPPPGWEDGCFNMSMNPGNCSDVCNDGTGTPGPTSSPTNETGTGTDPTLATVNASDVTTATGGSTPSPPEPTTGGDKSNTTVATPAPTTPKGSCGGGGGFDAASFIGGIVLMAGIVLIVFLACKFYKSRSESRYHQF